MSTCVFTTFDMVLHLTKELPEDKLREGVKWIQDGCLDDIFDLCIENNCFTSEQAETIRDFIMMFEDLDGNYWEEHESNYKRFLDSIGITEDIFEIFIED